MQNNAMTIRVSERDIDHVRKLVAFAMSTHGGVTLEYARCLSSELHQAEVVPTSRLPRNVITLNSRVWITDLDSGGKMIVNPAYTMLLLGLGFSSLRLESIEL